MKSSDNKKSKDKEPEIDFSQFTMDDIAKRVLETPPKKKKKQDLDKDGQGNGV